MVPVPRADTGRAVDPIVAQGTRREGETQVMGADRQGVVRPDPPYDRDPTPAMVTTPDDVAVPIRDADVPDGVVFAVVRVVPLPDGVGAPGLSGHPHIGTGTKVLATPRAVVDKVAWVAETLPAATVVPLVGGDTVPCVVAAPPKGAANRDTGPAAVGHVARPLAPVRRRYLAGLQVASETPTRDVVLGTWAAHSGLLPVAVEMVGRRPDVLASRRHTRPRVAPVPSPTPCRPTAREGILRHIKPNVDCFLLLGEAVSENETDEGGFPTPP